MILLNWSNAVEVWHVARIEKRGGMASTAAAVNSLDFSSAKVADREIKIWATQSSFPRTRILLTTGATVLCIFPLGWVSW